MNLRTGTLITILLTACILLASCKDGANYKFDTVTFTLSGTVPPPAEPEPNIHIDTHMKMSGMFGGTVKTSAPYSIGIDYTDETFTFAEAEFTKVVVSYDDGADDPGVAALKLPLRIPARPYETINSVAGGRIVKTKLRVISGEIPGVISRDKPITLLIEGSLIKDDGTRVPFVIKHKYDVKRNKSTRPWGEIMAGGSRRRGIRNDRNT